MRLNCNETCKRLVVDRELLFADEYTYYPESVGIKVIESFEKWADANDLSEALGGSG